MSPSLGVLFVLLNLLASLSNPRALERSTLLARLQPNRQVSDLRATLEVTKLELNKPVRRDLSGGQKHTYQLVLAQGQYAQVSIEQRGIDVVGHLFSSDDRLLADVDSLRTTQGAEKVELVAELEGNYTITIEPSLPKAGAGTYEIKLSESREATAEENLLDVARRQHYESLRLIESLKNDQALEVAARALETREKILGPEHPDVAASLRVVGSLYAVKSDVKRAELFLQRAAEVTKKTSGTNSLDYADVLHSSGRLRFSKGDLTQAEELNLRALSIREKVAGANSLPVAASLHNLASIYRAVNDFPKAEQTFLRSLAIREELLGPEHSEVAISLINLGLFYYGAGDYVNAERLLQRALTIQEKVYGSSNAQVGRALNNLGLVLWKKGDYAKAKAVYERALLVYEKTTGPDSEGAGVISHNLGIIYKEDGQNYGKAEAYYQRALAISLNLFGEDKNTALALSSLGILYRDMGDYDRAEKLLLRALAINERILGANNYYTSLTLRSLAHVYAGKGDVAHAIEYYSRIGAIEERILPLNLTLGSERQKIAYYSQLQSPDRVITLHVGLAGDNGAARDLAATMVLQRKGRILDALSENFSTLRRRFDPQAQLLLDSLGDINSQLSQLVLSVPQTMSAEARQTQIKTLEEKREQLEAEISRRSAGFYESSQPVTLAAVRAAVPADAALVEFTVYRPFNWTASDSQPGYGEPRYVAYVIRNQADVRWVELGAAKEIDARVDAFRQALRDPARRDARQLARAIDESVMQPVRQLLGDATRLLISPDGQLNLIPFAALMDEQNHYLIHRYAFSYLTSGRDLLRLRVMRNGESNPLVVANPSFGEPATDQNAKVEITQKPSPRGGERRTVIDARDLTEIYFAPLGGTALEANTIHTFFPNATVLTGAQATEGAIKAVRSPRVLHIATHGFFLQDKGVIDAPKTQVATRSTRANSTVENPLLRSGLALAGANRRAIAGNKDDGILTALEASGLNLWGTKLVVLSACDTGLGEVRTGEGVYGLRRSFVLAGAESLVMSLWPVSDYSTRKLMADYYRNLKLGMGRGEALRQVQLGMIGLNKDLHPFYWANFIQSGEWANLDGKR